MRQPVAGGGAAVYRAAHRAPLRHHRRSQPVYVRLPSAGRGPEEGPQASGRAHKGWEEEARGCEGQEEEESCGTFIASVP